MKRFIYIFLTIACVMQVYAAEQKDYSKYENLPKELYFDSYRQSYMLKPESAFGSEAAFKNFLSSHVISQALENGHGTFLKSIHLTISQDEFNAFVKFSKNLTSMTLFEAYSDAFQGFDGLRILADLKVNEKLMDDVRNVIGLVGAQIIGESAEKKRKRESEETVSSKESQPLPKVHIVRPGGLKTTLELNKEQVEQLNKIKNTTIANFIEDSTEPVVTLELSSEFAEISNDVINNFLNLIIKFYANEKKLKDREIFTHILEYLANLGVTDGALIAHNLATISFLADWFGYDQFSKKIQPLIILLSIPTALSKKEEQNEALIIKTARKLMAALQVGWSMKEIPDLLEEIEKIMRIQERINPASSNFDILKAFSSNVYITMQDLSNFEQLNIKTKKAILIATVLGYKQLEEALRGFYKIINRIQQIIIKSQFQGTPQEMAAQTAQVRALYLSLRADINKFAENANVLQRPDVLPYLQLIFFPNIPFKTVLSTLQFIQ
jgi:negative regulator of replication initiation